jgi:hypothetical protein
MYVGSMEKCDFFFAPDDRDSVYVGLDGRERFMWDGLNF